MCPKTMVSPGDGGVKRSLGYRVKWGPKEQLEFISELARESDKSKFLFFSFLTLRN